MFDPSPSSKTEPLFNVPWPVVGLCVSILGLYALQLSVPEQGVLLENFALNPVAFRGGAWDMAVTYMFLHGSWMHAGMNALWALAFATPVARTFGSSVNGVISFIGFYIVCGFVAGLGFVLLRSGESLPVVGASGAIAGLIGAAIRLRYKGILLPLKDKAVMGLTVTFIAINLLTEFVSLVPGVPAGAVAWQTHIFGYLCGLLLIQPWTLFFHRGAITQI